MGVREHKVDIQQVCRWLSVEELYAQVYVLVLCAGLLSELNKKNPIIL